MSQGKIKAGVIIKTRFCKPGSSQYKGYINYIDREKAKGKGDTTKYNLFADYMGNPEKSTGLFTGEKDSLTKGEKNQLKEQMKQAQDKGSLMWQTVISFDNRWLSDNGLYNHETKTLDEERIRSITRKAVEKMLHNEEIKDPLWSAAIHFNTDNIHVHVATVDPNMSRPTNDFVQYRYRRSEGQFIKEAILDANGQMIYKRERVGRFKQSSIGKCKSTIVNQILNEKDINKQINDLIRESIIGEKKENLLYEDLEFRKAFLDLYESMPDVDRKMWNYNSNVMLEVRPKIDALTDGYIKKYHPTDFEKLQNLIKEQKEAYEKAYGNNKSGNLYAENKTKDLYTRMGNTILREVRSYDRQQKYQEIRRETRSSRSTNSKRNHSYNGWRLARTLKDMDRALKSEYEKANNEWEHDRLVEQMMKER